MKLKLLVLYLGILLFAFGCSESNSKNTVSKDCFSNEDWEIKAVLQWDEKEVMGKIEAGYLGQEPLEFVVIEPKFNVGKWPEGYIPPHSGKYTWNAEKPEGSIPDAMETSCMSISILPQKPSRIMSGAEAAEILEKVKVKVQWKTVNGELKTINVPN
ncbi:hypothetical protein JOC37_000928 [Desulfohalotomaculum tongense]|nr:hypothetical protein [Desulforadius tongensis]